MNYLKILVVISISLITQGIYCQSSSTIVLWDKTENVPVSFAHISSDQNEFSTLSNEDGKFTVTLPFEGYLTITHIQYQPLSITVKELRDTLILQPNNYQIDPIFVVGDDNRAYDYLKKCKKRLTRADKTKTSKSYLSLQTHINDLPQEFIEGFYNGTQKQGMLNQLELKAGRVAMAPDHNRRYFVTLGNTKAILFHDILKNHPNYPLNPFSTRRPRKRYSVQSFIESKDEVYIKFVPKDKQEVYFEMELTMDRNTELPKQISLSISNTQLHPFVPIITDDKIDSMSISIINQYKIRNGVLNLELIQFKNDYVYEDQSRKFLDKRSVSTNAIVFNYKMDDQFFLPLFDYNSNHHDYRKISFFPYNQLLFEKTKVIDYSKFQKQSLDYFKEHGFILNFYDKQWNVNGTSREFFEENNILWDKTKRWALKSKTIDLDKTDIIPPSIVEIQHLIDVSKIDDSLHIMSRNLIDIFKSEYYLKNEPHEMAYINIAFDLSEIELRKTINEMRSLNDLDEIKKVYNTRHEAWNKLYSDYRRETNYGNNLKNLKKYNDLVKEELGIDNFSYFELSFP